MLMGALACITKMISDWVVSLSPVERLTCRVECDRVLHAMQTMQMGRDVDVLNQKTVNVMLKRFAVVEPVVHQQQHLQ